MKKLARLFAMSILAFTGAMAFGAEPAAAPTWWSLAPIQKSALPRTGALSPIDAFVQAKLHEKGLVQSPAADRRTLIRRLSYDLTGLPPSIEEINSFVADQSPYAYEKLVDRLLASPRYGERWARHWLDAVHYGDTHGYDKDKVRPNAWPYRDYVIRSFNDDKPYSQFVREQLAGDHFYPASADGILGLGFVAAGPFDFVGQIEVRDGTIDKAITRNLDRDDMVSATMNTFVSLTVQCARCHNHKFDPISQEDYYSLQAVFAAVDRADRTYDVDPEIARRRLELKRQLDELADRETKLQGQIAPAVAAKIAELDARIATASKPAAGQIERPEFGYHSLIAQSPDTVKWVQVDLGSQMPISGVVLVAAHDNFNGIGAGFGFPVRYKIEASDDPAFRSDVAMIANRTSDDVPNPGCKPQEHKPSSPTIARYVRLTATRLALRKNDYMLAMGEMSVLTADGTNVALGKAVSALDSIEAGARWGRKNLVDGYYYGVGPSAAMAKDLRAERNRLVDAALSDSSRRELDDIRKNTARLQSDMKKLPTPSVVYAAATEFKGAGSHQSTHGKPRPIYLLKRGSEKNPGQEVGPGTVRCVVELSNRFTDAANGDESLRRAALADWIVDHRNPLSWRSIVNRVWQYHFGRGIVETPNDFGKMGATPTHPELLDWLAAEFRDGGQFIHTPGSIKQLSRLIVLSETYRQSSVGNAANEKIDGSNQYLWRMNRDRLGAEAIRDSVLQVAGKLDLKMGGPGWRDFGFEDDHSPRYKYWEYDPDDAATYRRSVYRFIVRSAPNPMMETLDCADPSQLVPRRNETLTALQALSLLNNRFILRMSENFADRVRAASPNVPAQVELAYRLGLGRSPTSAETKVLVDLANKDGLVNVCRLIFNCNEFVFVD